jgi:hypothetical protein
VDGVVEIDVTDRAGEVPRAGDRVRVAVAVDVDVAAVGSVCEYRHESPNRQVWLAHSRHTSAAT